MTAILQAQLPVRSLAVRAATCCWLPRVPQGAEDDGQWHEQAKANDGGEPYFDKWAKSKPQNGPADRYARQNVATRAAARDYSDVDDDPIRGTLGIKETFHAVHPVASFPPANPEPYLPLWDAQAATFKALGIKSGFNPEPEDAK